MLLKRALIDYLPKRESVPMSMLWGYKWNPMSYRYACNVYLSPVRYPRFKTLQLPRFSLKARTCGGFMWFVEWFPSTRKVNRLYLKTSNLTQWGWYLTTTGILEFIPICNVQVQLVTWMKKLTVRKEIYWLD